MHIQVMLENDWLTGGNKRLELADFEVVLVIFSAF